MNTVELVAIADAGRTYNDGRPPAVLPYGDGTIANPAREREPGSCLGQSQRDWLLAAVTGSTATWKLWGNSIPLLPLRLDMSSVPFAGYEDSVFTIDAWQGYPGEATWLLERVQEAGVTGLVSLSGDHHMHGAGTIRARFDDPEATPVTVDFNCAGISSTTLFENVRSVAGEDHPEFAALVETEHGGQTRPNWNMTLLQGVLAAYAYHHTGSTRLARWLGPNRANPGLAFVDSTATGYGIAHFSAEQVAVSLVAVPAVQRDFTQPPPASYRAQFELPLWQAGKAPQLSGPRFLGAPPFPFNATSG
jgi:alkaline phosphatase D